MGAYANDTAFKEDIKKRTNGEYEFIDPYKGSTNKIRCRHNLCGTVFPVAPYNFKRSKHHCPTCKNVSYTFQMDGQGRVNRLVTVRCEHKHRFKLRQSKIPSFHAGKIKCPICEKLEVLDPLYKDSIVDLSFEMGLGGILS